MNIVGFNFTKISIEKIENSFENLKLDTNIHISDIKDVQTDIFKSKEGFISFEFKFILEYQPNIAKIDLEGGIVLTLDAKLAKEVLKQWESRKIPPELKLNVLNIILRKCNLKCLELEDELNLPLHFRLPTLTPPKEENKE